MPKKYFDKNNSSSLFQQSSGLGGLILKSNTANYDSLKSADNIKVKNTAQEYKIREVRSDIFHKEGIKNNKTSVTEKPKSLGLFNPNYKGDNQVLYSTKQGSKKLLNVAKNNSTLFRDEAKSTPATTSGKKHYQTNHVVKPYSFASGDNNGKTYHKKHHSYNQNLCSLQFSTSKEENFTHPKIPTYYRSNTNNSSSVFALLSPSSSNIYNASHSNLKNSCYTKAQK